jgi:hypothetical protein
MCKLAVRYLAVEFDNFVGCDEYPAILARCEIPGGIHLYELVL